MSISRVPGSKAECAACYIVGNNGGEWYGNRITTNTHAFWGRHALRRPE